MLTCCLVTGAWSAGSPSGSGQGHLDDHHCRDRQQRDGAAGQRSGSPSGDVRYVGRSAAHHPECATPAPTAIPTPAPAFPFESVLAEVPAGEFREVRVEARANTSGRHKGDLTISVRGDTARVALSTFIFP